MKSFENKPTLRHAGIGFATLITALAVAPNARGQTREHGHADFTVSFEDPSRGLQIPGPNVRFQTDEREQYSSGGGYELDDWEVATRLMQEQDGPTHHPTRAELDRAQRTGNFDDEEWLRYEENPYRSPRSRFSSSLSTRKIQMRLTMQFPLLGERD